MSVKKCSYCKKTKGFIDTIKQKMDYMLTAKSVLVLEKNDTISIIKNMYAISLGNTI